MQVEVEDVDNHQDDNVPHPKPKRKRRRGKKFLDTKLKIDLNYKKGEAGTLDLLRAVSL